MAKYNRTTTEEGNTGPSQSGVIEHLSHAKQNDLLSHHTLLHQSSDSLTYSVVLLKEMDPYQTAPATQFLLLVIYLFSNQ